MSQAIQSANILDLSMSVAESFRALDSQGACLENLDRFLKNHLGFDGLSYLETDIIRSSADWTPKFMTTAKADFIYQYLVQRLDRVDPVVHAARLSSRSFLWDDVQHADFGIQADEAQKVWDTAHEFGYGNGLVVPARCGLPSPQGGPQLGVKSVLVTCFWPKENGAFPWDSAAAKRIEYAARIAVMGFHDRLAEIEAVKAQDNCVPVLTAREKECLTWAACGKTAEDTAIIMNITERTVRAHLGSAMDKLGANCKTHAVARAIRSGLIDP